MDVNAMAFGVMCLCLPRAETHGRCSVVCRAGASFSSPSPPRASSQRTYFATCARGLGELLAKEIEDNVTDRIVAVKGSGVAFEGDASVGYRAAMNLRTATRVLERLAKSIVDPYDVHRAARDMVPWERYIASDQTFTVNVRSSGGREGGIRVRIKDAICDALIAKTNARPDPPRTSADADVTIFVSLHEDNLIMYRDLGGESLHKRGYRSKIIHASSLNECAAAAMAMMAAKDPSPTRPDSSIVVDPMCGSGTLLIEAAMLKLRIAPGLYRSEFPFQYWTDFNRKAWALVREEAEERQLRPENVFQDYSFIGNEIHEGSVSLARDNITRAGLRDIIHVQQGDINVWEPKLPVGLVLSNPPWGLRLGDEDEAWTEMGYFLKSQAPGADAYLLCGNPALTQHLRMRASSKTPIRLGDVDCRILKYHVLPPKKKS